MKTSTRLFLAAGLTAGMAAPCTLAQTPPPGEEERVLDTVIVKDSSQVELTREYAGGQVARGGRAGLLGNLDFLDAPFSGTAYTSDLILTGLCFLIYIIARERRRHVPYYGLAIAGLLLVGISCGLPLYYYLEERQRLRDTA